MTLLEHIKAASNKIDQAELALGLESSASMATAEALVSIAHSLAGLVLLLDARNTADGNINERDFAVKLYEQ